MLELVSVVEVITTSWGLLAIATALLAIYFIYNHAYAPYQVLKRYGFKGPKPSPFLGNYGLQKKLGWVKFYKQIHDIYGPVCGFYIGTQPHVKIADTELLKQVMVKEFDSFINRENDPDFLAGIVGLPDGLLFSKGEDWRRARHAISPTFSSLKIKMMVPHVKRSCDTLVEKLGEYASSEKSLDIFRVYGSFTMETILATAFGRVINLQRGEGDKLTVAAAVLFSGTQENQVFTIPFLRTILSNFPLLTPVLQWLINRSKRGDAMKVLYTAATQIVQARREASDSAVKHKDFLQLMIDTHAEAEEGSVGGGRRLSDGEIVSNSITFLLAGYETTANTLAYTSYLLALHPTIQDRLRTEIQEHFENNPEALLYDASHEIQYLDMVVNEALRLYPVAYKTQRVCMKTVILHGGVTISKGTAVDVPIHLLHNSPDFWTQPEVFNPERFSPEERAKRPQLCHMPFGWGPRNCVGMRFALMEAKMALIEVLRKYKFVQAPDTEVPLETILGITMAPKNGIYLKIAPYH